MRAGLLFLMMLAAGCLAPAADVIPARSIVWDGADAGDVVRWNNTSIKGGPFTFAMQENDLRCWMELPCDASPATCGEGNCERREFRVNGEVGAIVLSLRWPTVPNAKFDAWIEGKGGEVLARAPREYVSYTGLVARLESPPPGDYVSVIVARSDQIEYEAAIRLEPVDAAGPRELLPDLVTLPPTDLLLDTPQFVGVSYFAFSVPGVREATEMLGTKGCRTDEFVEHRNARCLRFSNAVANVGEGPLDVRLAVGALQFTQMIHSSDDSKTPRPAGAAQWHATHAHWHNAASTEYTVRTFDAETRSLNDVVGTGKKGGICFADTATSDVGLPIMRPAVFTGWDCLDPASTETSPEWAMGITPGWYDLYGYTLGDQYVDITGIADGAYALCSATNMEGTLLELDLSNNEACTPFELEGDTLRLLDPEPYHTIPEKYRI